MTDDKDEALRLAEWLDADACDLQTPRDAAAMLRSQHARISDLEEGARVLFTRITELESVARVALEALEWIGDRYVGDDDEAGECASCGERSYKPHADHCKKNNAIESLRKTLGEA